MDNLEQALNEVENGFTKNGQSGMKSSLYVTPAKCVGIGPGGGNFNLRRKNWELEDVFHTRRMFNEICVLIKGSPPDSRLEVTNVRRLFIKKEEKREGYA